MVLFYRSNLGLESYFTYTNLDLGDAGTAYIADATGQLKLVKNLVNYASAVNPFSLNLVYNSDYFAHSSNPYQVSEKMGLNMTVGSGWTLDCIQMIKRETISDVSYYVYNDGDGTLHYFRQNDAEDPTGTYYYDEDGLGLKIKRIRNNNYQMTDNFDNEWTFTNKYLTSFKSSDGNILLYNYTDGRLTSVQQKNKGKTAITVAALTYDGSRLISITDAAQNNYTLGYTGNLLTSISKNSAVLAEYSYSGNCIISATDTESGRGCAYTYQCGRVSSIQEQAGDETGARMDISYPDYTQTVYHDYGLDRTADTEDDLFIHYLCDYANHTVNTYTTDRNNCIIGAANAMYYGFYDMEDPQDATNPCNNRILSTASVGIVGQQMMRNFGFEDSRNSWTISGMSVSSSKARTGYHSVKNSRTGTVYAQQTSEPLTAGTIYTLSGYVNTSGVRSISGNGVYLKVTNY